MAKTTFLHMKLDGLLDFADIAQQARGIHESADQFIDQVKSSPHYSDSYKTELIKDQQAKTAQVFTDARAAVDYRRTHYLNAATANDAPAGDTSTQLLAETRAQRSWDRVRPQLESGRAWRAIARGILAR